jgi:hypothetical protein
MNLLKYIKCVILFSFIIYTAEIKAQQITIEPNNTVIVIGNRDWITEKASREMQRVLRKTYGTDKGFDVFPDANVTDAKVKDKTIISLGITRYVNTSLAKGLRSYGFIIKRNENIISILGEQPLGSLYGAVYFLDKYCDIRFYMPGDLFTHFPQQKKITIKDNIDVKEEPFTTYVNATGINSGIAGEGMWFWLNAVQRKSWESHQHSMGNRFPAAKFAEKYPEIYPSFAGKRYMPKNPGDQQWQPDFAEPHLVDAAVESAIDYFKAKPHIDYISFSVQDSDKYPVEGEIAKVLEKYPNTPQGKADAYTEAYIEFLNKVAKRLEKELPKQGISQPKTLVYLSYGRVSRIPKQKLHPSILPVLVSQISELDKDSVVAQPTNKDNFFNLSEWAKVTNRIGHHDWAQGHGYFYPRIYNGLYIKYLKELQKLGIQSEYMHVEFYPNWGLDGPKYYLIGKMLWSPEVNVDELLDQFCSDMFGRAKGEMKQYFTHLEELTYSMDNNPAIYRKMFGFPKQLLLNSKEKQIAIQARNHLNRAMVLARKGTDEERARIELFSKTFKLTEYLFEAANSPTLTEEKIKEIQAYVSEKITTDKMTLYSAHNNGVINWINSAIAAIKRNAKSKVK